MLCIRCLRCQVIHKSLTSFKDMFHKTFLWAPSKVVEPAWSWMDISGRPGEPQRGVVPNHGTPPDIVGKLRPKIPPEDRMTTRPGADWRCQGVWVFPRTAPRLRNSRALPGKCLCRYQQLLGRLKNKVPPPLPPTPHPQ